MGLRIGWLTVDSADPRAIGQWWKDALGLQVVHEDDEGHEYAVAGKGFAGSSWNVLFYKADGDKAVKNRLHLDLIPDDQDAEVARLESLGARRVDIGQGDQPWVVMADPDGNEFCVLSPRPDPVRG